MSVTCFGQGTQSIDSIQITEADSIHAGSHTFSDTKLEDVTKTSGTESIEVSALTLSYIHISFSRLDSNSNYCKDIF